MVRVMASGVFDLLHSGHLHFLEEAKKLGDKLMVVVATDNTVRQRKHEPITGQDMRLKMVAALRPVDKAILGREGDMYEIVEELKPDIIALGFDQAHDEAEIEKQLAARKINAKVVRLEQLNDDLSGTRKIIKKILDWHMFNEHIKKVEK